MAYSEPTGSVALLAFILPLQNCIDSVRFSHKTPYLSIKLKSHHPQLVKIAEKIFPVMEEQTKCGASVQKS